MVRNLPINAEDIRYVGLILGLGRFPGEGNGNPLQYSCLEKPMDRGAWCATIHKITKWWTWLKQLSMHTHNQSILRADLILSSFFMEVNKSVWYHIDVNFKALQSPSIIWKHNENQGNQMLWACCIKHCYYFTTLHQDYQSHSLPHLWALVCYFKLLSLIFFINSGSMSFLPGWCKAWG